MSKDLQSEIDKNYTAFKKLLPALMEKHQGMYALIRHGKPVEFFSSADDAMKTGSKLYDDELFSVQRVTTEPVDLGYFSHAVYLG